MPSDPLFFPDAAAFRAWLEAHHASARELSVGFYKVGTGKPSMTWEESVDEALCFGWIDGVRKRLDEERYTIRFTPRRPGSRWSRKNLASFERLRAEGRLRPAGLAAWEARPPGEDAGASYERDEPPELDGSLRERFRANEAAWAFFQAQPAGYRRVVTHWVATAKREETRLKRLDRTIEVSERGERIDLMKPFS
ncbi:MAG TPA: YdeI/OmpD-associated family protein [Thermoanaerobaculia bacterium]|nr:YdeI/OmpD-associated family protein [Thermoanaerobaculia bacterium]